MGLFDRKAPSPPPGRKRGPPAKIGDRVGVYLQSGNEPFVTGYLLAEHGGFAYICDPDRNGEGPWFGHYRPESVETVPGDPMPGEIITMTADDLTPGAEVYVHIRTRNTSTRGVFVCQFQNHRCVYLKSGAPASYPAQDVEPISRPVTAEQVMKMRDATGLGMMQCKTILQGRALRQELAMAENVDDLRRIVGVLLDKAYPEDHHTRRALEIVDQIEGR